MSILSAPLSRGALFVFFLGWYTEVLLGRLPLKQFCFYTDANAGDGMGKLYAQGVKMQPVGGGAVEWVAYDGAM
jgi:hypothetical protein